MTTTIEEHTASDTSEGGSGPATPMWAFTVAHHRERVHLGRQLVLLPGAAVEIGRGSTAFGPGVLDVTRLSREHAQLHVDSEGVLWVRDSGSRNGTQVNGQDVKQRALGVGDVVCVGRILLLVHRVTRATVIDSGAGAKEAELVGVNEAFCDARRAADQIAKRDTTVLLLGATGTGKTTLAEHIHRGSGREGSLVVIPCGAITDDVVTRELFGEVERGAAGAEQVRRGLLESADGGTVLFEEIGDASERMQASLLRFLDRGEIRKVGADQSQRIDARVVATSGLPLDALVAKGKLREDFARRMKHWVIALPPLGERLEDVGLLADCFLRRYGGDDVRLHHGLALQLLRRGWAGNVAELEAALEHALIAAAGAEVVRSPDMPLGDAGETATGDRQTVQLGRDGGWFKLGGCERVDLSRRRPLRRILAALVKQHEERPATAINLAGLMAAGWPDDRIAEEHGANRVYVALTTLRGLGLRDIIVRNKKGYLIAPTVDALVR